MATTWLDMYCSRARRHANLILTTGSWGQDLARSRETAATRACSTISADSIPVSSFTTLDSIGTITQSRKVREWTTLDLIVNYTFNLPASAAQNEVAGHARDGGKNTELKDGKGKNVMPVSTAEYNPCGWRAWLNNTTITLGMNNVFDQDPPFVAGNVRKRLRPVDRPISGGEPGMWH